MKTSVSIPVLRIPLQASLTLPGSKSHANRAIVCAVLAKGTTVIHGATPCDDVAVMVENLGKLGFDVSWIDKEKGELRINGGIPAKAGKGTLDCHNAGTTLRFLVSLACIVPGEWTITGDDHMKKRPIADLTTALKSLGADIRDTDGCPPIHIRGGTLKGGEVTLDASISSQFLSSLLLIAPMLENGLSVTVASTLASSGYIELTKKTMKDFGIQISQKSNTFIVQSGTYDSKSTYDIEGDWSAAGAWLVLRELTGSMITFPNLRPDSTQSDRALPSVLGTLRTSGDIVIDAAQIPDQVMNLAVLASRRSGSMTVTNAANLRRKECDRLAVITSELSKAGVRIAETADGIVVHGSKAEGATKAVTLDPHDDHRMAMCFAVLGLLRGNVSISNPDCVGKSYPAFFRDLEELLKSTRPVTVIGMRGVGKSSMGKRLASKLKLKHIDTDKLFEKKHGPIRPFVAEKGWPAFRAAEEEVLAEALLPGRIVSLGGGALISEKSRKLVRDRSIVVWLKASETELVKRLGNEKRPSLTDLPLHEEVKKLVAERTPHYREAAHIEVGEKLRFSEHTAHIIRELTRITRSPRS